MSRFYENSAQGRLVDVGTTESANSFKLLGIRVDVIQIDDAVMQMEEWIREGERCRYISVTGMHGVTEAQHDPSFKEVLNASDLVVPDGMPLVWIGRLRGFSIRRRVYGPELMLTFCSATVCKGYSHFFFGGPPGLAEKLAKTLSLRFPGLKVAGTFSPPYRPATPCEDEEIVRQINNAHPDIVWVGMSTPKQERWMRDHRERLQVPLLVGVGAAFDIHVGAKRQAPVWMREHGFEWLFRLLQEPKRLWRRYLVYGCEFLFLVFCELLHLRNFQ